MGDGAHEEAGSQVARETPMAHELERLRAAERCREIRDVLDEDRWGPVSVLAFPRDRTFVIRLSDNRTGVQRDYSLEVPAKDVVRDFLYPDLPAPVEIDPSDN
jgi:hypothetical protein